MDNDPNNLNNDQDGDHDPNDPNQFPGEDSEEYQGDYEGGQDDEDLDDQVDGDEDDDEGMDDIAESVDEDEDDDFPEYANQENKELHQIILEKRRLTKELAEKIDEKSERVKILEEHLKNVKSELLNTQALIDEKNKQIETEDHLKQVSERQNGRIEEDLRQLDEKSITIQERLNDLQNQIFKGNEKMDQYKMEMNWNQEEMEQWVLAYRQKEADNLALEKYKRHDEAQIKKLRLEIQKLTSEVTRNQTKLEREITETQAAQIELDRTAEEFKKQHNQRNDLFNKWDEAQKNVERRNRALEEETEKFKIIHQQTITVTTNLENEKEKLMGQKRTNQNLDVSINLKDRQITQQRTKVKNEIKKVQKIEADVNITKTQLSGFSSDLQKKKTEYENKQLKLLNNKQRLKQTQQRFLNQKAKWKKEININAKLRIKHMDAQAFMDETQKEEKDILKRKRQTDQDKTKAQDELFRQKAKEAFLYGAIQGVMAACKNLQSHINKLAQDFQRQQELLYNAEYQIQLMERLVSKARGQVNHEEQQILQKQMKEVKEQLDKKLDERKDLEKSLKQLQTDINKAKREISKVEEQRQRVMHLNYELKLQNQMATQDVEKIVRTKEDTLVKHDCMKLEIKKIHDVLMTKTDEVFNLENKKHQVEMSMQEREREIQLHKKILMAEYKAAEEERHKVAVQLSAQRTKVNNHKIKYESLIQKNKPTGGEVESPQEHSQAYYVIKAAQEREELQRKGDELHAEIMKNKKEIKALDNTLKHLKNRNAKYRDSFHNKGTTRQELARKKMLEDQQRAASENLFRKKKELEKIEKEFDEDTNRLKEVHARLQVLTKQKNEANAEIDSLNDDFVMQDKKISRATKTLESRTKYLTKRKSVPAQNSAHMVEVDLQVQKNLTKSYFAAILAISADYPELHNILDSTLNDNQVALPQKAPSVIDIMSVASSRSGRSQRSQRSR